MLIGINYKNAVSILKQRGFTNIKTSEQKDLMPQEASKAGNVTKVIVGSFSQKTVFEPNSLFPFDSEITIIYHTERTILSRLLHKPKKQTPSIRVNRIRKENSSFHSCFYMLFKGIFIMILCVIGLVATCVILGYIVRAGYL